MIKRIAVAVAFTAFVTVSAQAATITVNTGSDLVGDDGACSLREAITAANSNTASGAMADECAAGDDGAGAGNPADSIAFAGGVSTVELNGALPTITDRLVIDGGGTVTIAPASAVQTNFFVVDDINNTNPGLSEATFQNLTIQGADEQGLILGGAVRLVNNGPTQQALNITNVEFRNNLTLDDGGAIGVAGNVVVSIADSRFYGNTAIGGGAIAAQDDPRNLPDTGFTPQLMISGSTFGSAAAGEGNIADGNDGGALAFETTNPTTSTVGSLAITGSSFVGNTAIAGSQDGGAIEILNGGVINITNSIFDANTAVRDGGAVQVRGTESGSNVLTITDSRFTNNQSGREGGGLILSGNTFSSSSITTTTFDNNTSDAAGAGIRLSGDQELTIASSTISNNSATGVSGSGGGVVCNGSFDQAAVLRLVNSTVSGNTAAASGGGISASDVTCSVEMYNATITNNMADSDNASGGDAGGFAGGSSAAATHVTMANTILAGNTVGATGARPDCNSGISGNNIESQGYNIIGSNEGCAPFYTANSQQASDQIGDVQGSGTALDPMLMALADNGGPTQTHDLLAGSPALDAGNPSGCLDDAGATLSTDQRGFTRPDGTACDVGAVEFQTTPPAPDVVASANNGTVMPSSATAGDADIEAVGVKFANNSSETLELASLTLSASGPNAAADITAVNLYADTNCNGDIDSGENTAIASAAGFGSFPIAPAITLAAGGEVCFVATVDTNTVLAAWAMPVFAASSLLLVGLIGLGGRARRQVLLLICVVTVLGMSGCHGDDDDDEQTCIENISTAVLECPPGVTPNPDTDGDGVANSIDACPGTPAGTAVDATGCPLAGPNSAQYSISVTDADISITGGGASATVSGLPVTGQTITVTEP